MRNSFNRSWQTAIIFLVVGGILALALGGYLGRVSSGVGNLFIGAQTWFSTRYSAIQDFLAAPRDITTLRQRNSELEAEVSSLQGQVIELQQQVKETEILAALVDFSRANPEAT
jgi:rod shape-determining protein MreC